MALSINGTTGISGIDGSASSPVLAGTDSNTGLSFGTDIVNINTGGTVRATLDASGNLNIPNDSGRIRLGTGSDLELFHDGSHSAIQNSTGNLHIKDDIIKLQSYNGTQRLVCDDDGTLEIYYAGDRVFRSMERGVRLADNTRIVENSSHNTATIFHADIHHAIILRGRTNNTGTTITNENTTTFREYGQFKFRCGNNGNMPERLTIQSNGQIGAPSGSNIYNGSDVRMKKNVTTLDKGLAAIKSLRPVKFNWIDGFCDDEKDPLYGFIAQEVQSVDSNLVKPFTGDGSSVFVGDPENPTEEITNPLTVNEKFIIPMLVKAIQELETRVAALEAA